MKSSYRATHLHNHLDPASHTSGEEAFGHHRSDRDNESADDGKKVHFGRGAGLTILLLLILFVLQRYFLPVGPDFVSVLRMIPLTGAILVLIIAFGLLSHARSVRKRKTMSSTGVHTHAASEKTAESKDQQGQDVDEPGSPGLTEDPHKESYGYEKQKKWYCSREEKMLFGVCGGIAERFDIDPTIVRALFALAFLSYGFSLVIYLVLAVILPRRPQLTQ